MRAHALQIALWVSLAAFGCDDDDSQAGGAEAGAGGSAESGADGLARLFGQEDRDTAQPNEEAPEAGGAGGEAGGASGEAGELEPPQEVPAASAECLQACGDLVTCLTDLCAVELKASACDDLCVGVSQAELDEVPTCEALRMVDPTVLCEELFTDDSREPTPTAPEQPSEEETPVPIEEDPSPSAYRDTCCAFYDCASDCLGDEVCVQAECDVLCGGLSGAEDQSCSDLCEANVPEPSCF